MAKISARGDHEIGRVTKPHPTTEGLRLVRVVTASGRVLGGIRGGGHQGYTLVGKLKSGVDPASYVDRLLERGWDRA